MTSSPISSTLAAALPSLRSASPLPQILRSAAASSSSSLSSLFQVSKEDGDTVFTVSDEARRRQALIAQAFGPAVAVVTSRECDDMLKGKGCSGLLELLRPFGDQVQGRVNVRDSQAMSIPVDDFSVNFVDFHHYAENTTNGQAAQTEGRYAPKQNARTNIPGGDLEAIEQLLEKRIESLPQSKEITDETYQDDEYSFFLRRILSAIPVSAHETFSHPVACVLAVSSRHPEPIDAFLGLYNTTNNAPIPRFIDAGFLRYYVLVHDDDNDDIDK
jgi:trafficking protein particle complex subunit 8